MTERSIFIAAVEIDDPEERSAFLDENCASDASLRQRVAALLRAFDGANQFMEQPAVVQELLDDDDFGAYAEFSVPANLPASELEGRLKPGIQPTELPGTQIGRYKLLQQIGEGGFGVVYMAEQIEPVRRKVALKIIKPGMDTKEVIARFEAERQALAMMEHPNIARVLDAGTTGEEQVRGQESGARDQQTPDRCLLTPDPCLLTPRLGRPYFVMELVNGVPITEFCDANEATTRERVELFVMVCRAVQHAHQKGIIHRDLKPSNIMVTLHDGRPVPKVIDFGVAKALKHELTERTLFTAYGQMIGTPAYMSPEQAEMSGLDVDTRSDIYALGVLLYELLTGRTPLDAERLRGTTYAEMQRIIREEEPPRPSARLSELCRMGRVRGAHHFKSQISDSKSQSGGPDGALEAGGPRRLGPPYETELTIVARLRATDPQRLRREIAGDLDWIVMKAMEKDRTRRYETANGLVRDVERYLKDEPVEAGPPSALYRTGKFARRHKRAFFAGFTAALVLLLVVIGLAVSNVLIRQEQARTAAEKDRAEKAHELAEHRAEENRLALERLKAANAFVDQSHVYSLRQQWDDAGALLTKAIELRPEYATAWEERGDLYAALGLWDLAAADSAEAFTLHEPAVTQRWYSHALLRATVGDVAGYEEVCSRMHLRFGGILMNQSAIELIRTCTLAPDSQSDPARLVELGEAVVALEQGTAWFHYVLGVALYRAGQHESAIGRLRESLELDPNWPARAINYPVLAMAYHRVGRHEQAVQALDEASRAIDHWTQQRYEGAEGYWVVNQGATAFWPITWQDWLECQLQYREARNVVGLLPPPDDPRLHVLRARAFAGLRKHDMAVREYTEALWLRPDDAQIRLEAHRCRGYHYAQLRQWDQAADEFARASELQPTESYFAYFQAISHVAAGDLDAYRRVCVAMLERFGQTQDARTAHALTETCILVPDALPDPARLIPAARVAATWYSGAGRMLGAALFRAGQFDEAIQTLEAAAKLHHFSAGDFFFSAMAQIRLGRAEAARRLLAEGVAWIEEADLTGPVDVSGSRPVWGAWHEPIEVSLLRREAEKMIEPPTEH